MSRYVIILILVVGMMATANIVKAATLWAGPLLVDSGGNLDCIATNVSDKDVEVTMEALNFDGVVIAGPTTEALSPGQSTEQPGHGDDNPAICKVSFKGKETAVRLTACSSPSTATINLCAGGAVTGSAF
jgi:hypothetical protein